MSNEHSNIVNSRIAGILQDYNQNKGKKETKPVGNKINDNAIKAMSLQGFGHENPQGEAAALSHQ